MNPTTKIDPGPSGPGAASPTVDVPAFCRASAISDPTPFFVALRRANKELAEDVVSNTMLNHEGAFPSKATDADRLAAINILGAAWERQFPGASEGAKAPSDGASERSSDTSGPLLSFAEAARTHRSHEASWADDDDSDFVRALLVRIRTEQSKVVDVREWRPLKIVTPANVIDAHGWIPELEEFWRRLNKSGRPDARESSDAFTLKFNAENFSQIRFFTGFLAGIVSMPCNGAEWADIAHDSTTPTGHCARGRVYGSWLAVAKSITKEEVNHHLLLSRGVYCPDYSNVLVALARQATDETIGPQLVAAMKALAQTYSARFKRLDNRARVLQEFFSGLRRSAPSILDSYKEVSVTKVPEPNPLWGTKNADKNTPRYLFAERKARVPFVPPVAKSRTLSTKELTALGSVGKATVGLSDADKAMLRGLPMLEQVKLIEAAALAAKECGAAVRKAISVRTRAVEAKVTLRLAGMGVLKSEEERRAARVDAFNSTMSLDFPNGFESLADGDVLSPCLKFLRDLEAGKSWLGLAKARLT